MNSSLLLTSIGLDKFGFEASPICVVLVVAIAIVIILFSKNDNKKD